MQIFVFVFVFVKGKGVETKSTHDTLTEIKRLEYIISAILTKPCKKPHFLNFNKRIIPKIIRQMCYKMAKK